MACSFSYTFDLSSDKRALIYKSDSGRIYFLTHELKWTIYGNSILNISVECNTVRNVLVVGELCSANENSIKSTALLEDNVAHLNYQNVNFLIHHPWRCIISIIPHFNLQDSEDSAVISSGHFPVVAEPIKETRLEQLSVDMKHILESGDLSDVVLACGTAKISAHKVILSARSTVFAKMFQHPMKENSENCVLIADISENILKELIFFIYTGSVAIDGKEMAHDLYMAADKYAINDLKKICSDMLKNVTTDDVLDILALAHLYEDNVLKQSSLEFISKNYSQVKCSKNWESVMKENHSLAIEILNFVIENKV